jgi:hypothetical protein
VNMRDRWLVWPSAILMVAIAAAQIGMSRLSDLSPWLGGGFGMFSSDDTGDARRLVARLVEPDGTDRRVLVGEDRDDPDEDSLDRAREFPTAYLASLASLLAARAREHAADPRSCDTCRLDLAVIPTALDIDRFCPFSGGDGADFAGNRA